MTTKTSYNLQRKIFSTLAIVFFAGVTQAADLNLDKGHVEFLAIGKPSAIKIRGKGDALTGKMQYAAGKLTGGFVFDMNSLDTGIDLRNEHTKNKYLEVAKYPKSELTLDAVSIAKDLCKEKFTSDHQPFTGTLKLHGVGKPVKGEFDVTAEGGHGHSQARFTTAISDFKIDTPTYLSIKVADQVENTVDVTWTCAK